MGLQLNMNTVNQVAKGMKIYKEGETATSVCLVVKGRVKVHTKGISSVVGSGSFIGLNDLYQGQYQMTYTAYDNTVLYPFPVRDNEGIEAIISNKSEYGSLMVVYLNKYIANIMETYRSLYTEATSMYTFMKLYYEMYQKTAKKNAYSAFRVDELEKMTNYSVDTIIDREKIGYFIECGKLPLDVQKQFYSNSTICLYNIQQQVEQIDIITSQCRDMTEYILDLMDLLISKRSDCIFRLISNLLISMNNDGKKADNSFMDSIDSIIEKINKIEDLFMNEEENPVKIDREELESVYFEIISGKRIEEVSGSAEGTGGVEMVSNVLDKLLTYSMMEPDKCDEFRSLIEQFHKMKDKFVTDDTSRALRKRITALYFELYKKVFIRDFSSGTTSLINDLFLKYGLVDEKLISKEQLIELLEVNDWYKEENGLCNVYSMKEWLELIYKGEKKPSKNEFDQDFEENIRHRKRLKEITEEEGNRLLQDREACLDYELQNMFMYNNRIVSGQISTYVPILYEENFVGNIEKLYVSAAKVNEEVDKIRKTDYSIFYREVFFEDKEKGIQKEYVMKEIFPDIILMPMSGSNGVMWQDISGRNRNTPGRWLLPIFMGGNLEDVIVQLMGRFRWELCRTIQGAAWNNIKYHSLTSEYMDYVQFYRKNRELSEERKEKLKLQIQKSRNNIREVFVVDYVQWVRNESQGAIRLTKPVREIMATYCPFNKELRARLDEQVMFRDAMAKFKKESTTKAREMELRKGKMEKEGKEMPEPIMQTLIYYRDL